MKRLLTILLIILLIFSFTACGDNTSLTDNESSDVEHMEQVETESPEQTQQSESSEDPVQAGDQKGTICVNYNAYIDARNEFDEYVLEQSQDHEIVSVSLGLATVYELGILDYLLPLEFMGESIKTLGKFDAGFETSMLQVGWADDAELTYNQETGYMLKGTDTNGSTLEIKTRYDAADDSLRLEGYKDGNLQLVFEYIKIDGGYAAQYYFETVTGNDKGTPIFGLCTYRTIFKGSNGSCARFDNVETQLQSILGSTPEAEAFIDGATHWFTITDGSFKGNLSGKEF